MKMVLKTYNHLQRLRRFIFLMKINRYRFQGRGLAEVLKIASSEISGLVNDLVMLIKYKDIPVTVVKTDLTLLKKYVAGYVSYDQWANQAVFS